MISIPPRSIPSFAAQNRYVIAWQEASAISACSTGFAPWSAPPSDGGLVRGRGAVSFAAEQRSHLTQRARRKPGGFEARAPELVRFGGERASSLAAVDSSFVAEHAECFLYQLGRREELLRNLNPRRDPFNDLASDRLRVSGGFESVLEPSDAV